MFKKGKKEYHIWKFGQKFTKFENILKRGRWLHTIITPNKQLENAPVCPTALFQRILCYIWVKRGTKIFYFQTYLGHDWFYELNFLLPIRTYNLN